METFKTTLATILSAALLVDCGGEICFPFCSGHFQPLPIVNTAECSQALPCSLSPKYRTINGSCSNPQHPTWGQAGTPYIRILPARYYDGKDEPRRSVTGRPLPNVRQLSSAFFPDRFVPDDINTLNLMQFGQLIAHDITHLSLGQTGSPCCTTSNQLPNTIPDACLPIEVSRYDEFFSQYNVRCLAFTRANSTDNGTCQKYPIEQTNINTHVIDASMVYGSDDTTAQNLRSLSGGKLLVQETEDGRQFLPNTDNSACFNPPTENICYEGGDNRLNQNIGITVYQIILMRLHNFLCDELQNINPQWNDERLYQEARKILGAILQHITFKHFLPIILGERYMRLKGLSLNKCFDSLGVQRNCINYYNPNVNPSTISEHAGAAYRSFHSMVPREIVFFNEYFEPYDYINLDDYYFRPTIIQQPKVLDAMLRGLAAQNEQKQDHYFSVALTQYLLKDNQSFGSDLESIDMQRGRDLGLPLYNEMRYLCGLNRARDFADFGDVMTEESIRKLRSFYFSVNDIDLFVGGMMEKLIPGALVGYTFQCIIGEQFYHYQRGDYFYYENCGLPSSFSVDQLTAIYRTSVAWIFCTTGDNIQAIQSDTFRKPSFQNPIVPCNRIASLDLSAWKE